MIVVIQRKLFQQAQLIRTIVAGICLLIYSYFGATNSAESHLFRPLSISCVVIGCLSDLRPAPVVGKECLPCDRHFPWVIAFDKVLSCFYVWLFWLSLAPIGAHVFLAFHTAFKLGFKLVNGYASTKNSEFISDKGKNNQIKNMKSHPTLL